MRRPAATLHINCRLDRSSRRRARTEMCERDTETVDRVSCDMPSYSIGLRHIVRCKVDIVRCLAGHPIRRPGRCNCAEMHNYSAQTADRVSRELIVYIVRTIRGIRATAANSTNRVCVCVWRPLHPFPHYKSLDRVPRLDHVLWAGSRPRRAGSFSCKLLR